MFDKLIADLKTEFKKALPGEDAQMQMAPLIRKHMHFYEEEKKTAKISAVLILLYPCRNTTYFPLMLRTSYEGMHSSQVSFPGGKFSAADKDLYATALRETNEEFGVDPDKVNLLGELTTLYIPPSNFLVHPFVGYTTSRPDFSVDKNEVEKLLEVNIDELLDQSKRKTKKILQRSTGLMMETPYFDIQGETVWGATAMMISELNVMLNNSLK